MNAQAFFHHHLTLAEVMDGLVGIAGAAVTMTFTLIVAAMTLGLAVTSFYAFIEWLAR
jgi:hypothetical protein